MISLKLDKMENFLDIYVGGDDGDLWQKIDSENVSEYLCMDMDMESIDEDNFYGFDFTNNKKVYRIFLQVNQIIFQLFG